MKEQNKYDDLESFFRSQLKDDKISQDTWNEPPEFVFDNAIEAIDEPKEKRRGILWIFSGLIIFGFSLLFLNLNSRLNQINTEIAEIKTSKTKESINSTLENASRLSSIDISEPQSHNDLHNSTSELSKSENGITNEQFQNANSTSKQSRVFDARNQNLTILSKEKSITVSKKETPKAASSAMTANAQSNNPFLTVEKLRILDISPIKVETNNFLFSEFKNLISGDRDGEISEPAWSLWFALGPNYTSYRMKPVSTTSSTKLSRYQDLERGTSVDLGLTRKINSKWNAYTKFSWLKSNTISQFNSKLQSADIIQIQDVGDMESIDMRPSSNTPLTSNSFDATMTTDSFMVDQMNCVVDSEESLSFLALELGLERVIWEGPKLKLSAQVGGATKFNISARQESDFKVYENTKMKFWSNQQRDIKDEINDWSFDLLGGLILDYNINRTSSIVLNTNYRRGISALNGNHKSVNQKSYTNILQVGIGLRKSF